MNQTIRLHVLSSWAWVDVNRRPIFPQPKNTSWKKTSAVCKYLQSQQKRYNGQNIWKDLRATDTKNQLKFSLPLFPQYLKDRVPSFTGFGVV